MLAITGPNAVDGRWNVFGTEDGLFILQGNLSIEQLIELKKEIDEVLKAQKVA
jgi:hypothetical protein